MRYSEKQKEIIKALEELPHNRFSMVTLHQKLTDIFGAGISPIELVEPDEEGGDFNLIFESYVTDDSYGFFDIYYLPTRMNSMYITEVDYDFENQ